MYIYIHILCSFNRSMENDPFSWMIYLRNMVVVQFAKCEMTRG